MTSPILENLSSANRLRTKMVQCQTNTSHPNNRNVNRTYVFVIGERGGGRIYQKNMQRVLPSLYQSRVCRGMDVFDIDVTAKMSIMHVHTHWASSGNGQHRRDEKTQRDVAQSLRHNSILKLIMVCKRFNIDVLHPRSMHMVLSLLRKAGD